MNYKNIPLTAFILFILSFIFSSSIFSNPSNIITGESDTVITFDSIKNELSADGEWIKVNPDDVDAESVDGGVKEFDDELNTDYVWRPNNVDENWSPYTNGYWRYTNCGWMWVSNYNWGWRPFHYGRWWWSPIWGWVWSPGYVWAPAWVVWMYYGDYWGWYPISPRARWHHRHGYHCHHIRYRVKHWTFVEKHNFLKLIDDEQMVPKPKVLEILPSAKYKGNVEFEKGKVINTGPEVTEVENSTGSKVTSEDAGVYNSSKKVNEIIEKEKFRNPDTEIKSSDERQYKSDDKRVSKDEEKTGKDGWINNDQKKEKEKYKEPEKKYEPEKKKEPEKKYEPEKKKEPERKIENKENNNNNNAKSNNNNQNNNNNEKPKDVNQPVKPSQGN